MTQSTVRIPIRLSHSAFSTFRHCEQQFKYSYVDNLESLSDKWRSTKDLGTAIHEGIAHLLNVMAYVSVDSVDAQIDIATRWALHQHDEIIEKGRTDWTGDLDEEYYAKMLFNREIIPSLLATHIPMIELGTRYLPVMSSEFFSEDAHPELGSDAPLVEWVFQVENVTARGNEAPIEGIVDAVLYDTDTREYILYDWKVRGRMLEPTSVAQDVQLLLYSTVINHLSDTGAQVATARMYQMLNRPPKPAKLTTKGALSKTAHASYWDFYWNSIPSPMRRKLDPAQVQKEMAGKLRDRDSWVEAVDIPITHEAMVDVSRDTDLTIDRITDRLAHSDWLPSWSAHGCEFCQFKKLCQARRHGLLENVVIEEGYRQRQYNVDDEQEDD